MLITGIKSRPVYRALSPDLTGRFHLLAAQGTGGAAVMRLLDQRPNVNDVHILYARESISGNDFSEALEQQGLADLRIFATQAELVVGLEQTLTACVMGTRLYLAGSESFIGSAVQVAMKFHLNADEIQQEHCGSAARRVYCIHCRFANDKVTTNVTKCHGCGRNLIVRDHYSQRLGAYMGVMADAEVPGQLPPIKEIFG